MKEERMEKYLELFASSNDFGGQVLDQLKLIRKFMSLKSLNPELNLILWDWNKDIEKDWKKEIEKLQKNYETTEQGAILPKHFGDYIHNKIYIDYMFLLRMCLDIGIIDRKLSTIQNGEDN